MHEATDPRYLTHESDREHAFFAASAWENGVDDVIVTTKKVDEAKELADAYTVYLRQRALTNFRVTVRRWARQRVRYGLECRPAGMSTADFEKHLKERFDRAVRQRAIAETEAKARSKRSRKARK